MATEAGRGPRGTRRRVAVVGLAVAALAAGWVLFGSGSDPDAVRLTPGALSSAQEDYDGERVQTVGIVRRFGPEDGATHLHFVVEDEDQNRVGLIGGDPVPHVGRTVMVVGTFRFAADVGRWIEVERLEER